MINGIAPVLIFTFPLADTDALFKTLSGVPLLTDNILKSVGIPIPIYLDERLTGIYIDSESKNIDIQTTVEATKDGETPDISQRGIDSTVTVNMKASKNSVVLTAILALIDMAFQRVVSKSYNVSYFNGSTTIIGGLLHGFSTSIDSDNDLVMITLQLSKSNMKISNPLPVPNFGKVSGTTPILGS